MADFISLATCDGCRCCELACSFTHTGRYQPSCSSIEIQRNEKEGKFFVKINTQANNGHYACTGCGECLDFCPDVARKDLRDLLLQYAPEKTRAYLESKDISSRTARAAFKLNVQEALSDRK